MNKLDIALIKLGIYPNSSGYSLIKTMLKLYHENENAKIGELYKQASILHDTTYTNIEKKIRYCFKNQLNLKQFALLTNISEDTHLTTGKFISLLYYALKDIIE